MVRALLTLAFLVLTSCSPPELPPRVAPLRYARVPPAADAPFRSGPPPETPLDPKLNLPIRSATLSNGMRVAVVERHGMPVVSARLVVTRGSADVPSARRGGMEFLAAMLAESKTERPPEQLDQDRAYRLLGARATWATSADGSVLSIRSPAASLDDALRLAAESVVAPAFPDADVKPAREHLRARFASEAENGDFIAFGNVGALLFGEDNAFWPSRRALWRALEPLGGREARALHGTLFRAEHAALLVAGDVTLEAVKAIAEAQFGRLPRMGSALPRGVPPGPPPRARAPVALVYRAERAMTHGYVAARGPAAWTPEADALTLVAEVLDSRGERLQDEIRTELGAAYAYGAKLGVTRTTSILVAGGAFEEGKAGAALAAVVAELGSLRSHGIAPDSLQKAKTKAIAKLRAQTETVEGLTNLLAGAVLTDAPFEAILASPARLLQVSAADVARAVAEYLAPEAIRIAVVGDRRFMKRELEDAGLGPIEERNGNGGTD